MSTPRETPGKLQGRGAAFGQAYADGRWGAGLGSGTGSQPFGAQPWINWLSVYLRRHRIGSVTDLGCGDGRLYDMVNWRGAAYHGVDVVPAVIDANRQARPHATWTCGDIVECDLPAASLAIAKDVLQHLPNADITVMAGRLAVYPRVLLVNSAAGVNVNQDIEAGGFRSLELSAAPFCWSVTEVFRWTGDEPKVVCEML